MRLSQKALAIALGTCWGMAVLIIRVVHLFWPGYGGAFLDLIASVYPGAGGGGWRAVLVGAAYGTFDGAVCGIIVAWLYNLADVSTPRRVEGEQSVEPAEAPSMAPRPAAPRKALFRSRVSA